MYKRAFILCVLLWTAVGKTNYNLKGSPGGFNKLKAPVNNSPARLIVNMGKVRL